MVHIEQVGLTLKGTWQDTYEYVAGPNKGSRIVMPVQTNQIQNTGLQVASGLFAQRSNHHGVKYMAVGTGQVSWDTVAPTQLTSATTLETEIYRKEVFAGDMGYVAADLAVGSALVTGPTSKIQITVTLETSQGNGALREFALFGGNVTSTADSGLMINWVVHSLITKDATLSLTRIIEIEFQ